MKIKTFCKPILDTEINEFINNKLIQHVVATTNSLHIFYEDSDVFNSKDIQLLDELKEI